MKPHSFFFKVMQIMVVAGLALAACGPVETTEPVTVVADTPIVVSPTPTLTPEPTLTPTPKPTEPLLDTLVICLGSEPDTLYPYGGSMLVSSQVWEAVYDGPIDNRSFSYQAVILEKLPSLADGDAVINVVTVHEGDFVVDAEGELITLTAGAGQRIKPAGCNNADCAVDYTGGDAEMDQMVVTFTLLPGLTWSDGTPLTASDSLYSFNLNEDPDTPASVFVNERTALYEALDEVTNVWTGLPGYLDSTYFINFWTPYPEHIWGQLSARELLEAEESSRSPMGWGPYVIEEWVAGESITLSRNANYFRADEGLPRFQNLIYRFVGEDSESNIQALLSGECDIVDQTANLSDEMEQLIELDDAGQLNANFVTGTVWEHADFGITPRSYDNGFSLAAGDRPNYFGDARTRRAIAMCMDRQAVVDTVLFGQSTVVHTYLPPQHPLFNANTAQYPFDVAAGSALLEEVGWRDDNGDGIREAHGIEGLPDGARLSFNYSTTTATQRVAVVKILVASLKQCKIEAKPAHYAAGDFFADGPGGRIFGRLFDMGQFAWLTGVQPPCDLWMTDQIPGPTDEGFCGWGCSNNTGYSDPAFDAACTEAQNSLPGQDSYFENHMLAQEIFADQLPVIPLYLRLKLAATRPDMCNFIMDPTATSEMWNIEEFSYGQQC